MLADESLQLLQSARDLITDPKRWTRGATARTSHGTPTNPRGEKAVRFCAFGALSKMVSSDTDPLVIYPIIRLLNEEARSYGYETIIAVNDTHPAGYAMVLAIYDAVIARATTEEDQPNDPMVAPLFASPIALPESAIV